MRRLTIALVLAVLGFEPASAQQRAAGGFFFVYAPHDRAMFEAGYRRHLEWHRAAGDSLAWFGWDVLVGPRPDVFVDGVFGTPFRALDVRVDPAGDQADAAVNVLAHADPVVREMVSLRRDLSSATPLEDGMPTTFVEVVWYEVMPGKADAFERTLSAAVRQASGRELLPYTIYERTAGAEPGFVLMVWRTALSSFDEHDRSPRQTIDRILDASSVEGTLASLVRSSRSEVWRFRRDLTYLGSRDDER